LKPLTPLCEVKTQTLSRILKFYPKGKQPKRELFTVHSQAVFVFQKQ
jgi:hypothetical protein